MVMLEELLCSDWCCPCDVRAEFLIKGAGGQKCSYSLTLGFGSSYTIIIPPTLTFGDKVSHKHI